MRLATTKITFPLKLHGPKSFSFVPARNMSSFADSKSRTSLVSQNTHTFAKRGSLFDITATKPLRRTFATATAEAIQEETTQSNRRTDSILGLMMDLQYPVSIVGTTKPGKRWWWAPDPNISFLRDIMNPSIFFTFKDSTGKLLRKVRYETWIVSYGVKLEIAIRPQIGILTGPLKATFDNIPEQLEITGGWDIAYYFGNFGWIDIKELPGSRIYYVGLGWAGLGVTKVDGEDSFIELNKSYEVELVE